MQTPALENPSSEIVRSVDEIRDWIVGEISKTLNVDASSINTIAPLDTLGVDSLGAIGLTGGLSGWLNCDLPATLMWDYASIDAIALGMADPEVRALSMARPGVVNLQPSGDRLPLFFFPGLGGHPVSFTYLASHLGESQPCYGLTVPGLTGKEKMLTNLQDMTAAMLKNLRLIQPKGPYQLAGYSYGGLLAYEAAQQLTAAGERVRLVAMYDTFLRNGRCARPLWQRLCIHVYLLATRENRLEYILERARRIGKPKLTKAAEAEKTLQPTIGQLAVAANHKAMYEYHPRPYAGSVVRFRAGEGSWHDIFFKTEREGGFSKLVQRIKVIDLLGNHLSILNEQNSVLAAEALKPLLSSEVTAN